MLERLVHLDKEVFVFLNGLGSSEFDSFWLFITKQTHWAPVFILVFYFLQRKIGWKNLGWLLLTIALLVFCTDQLTNLVKNNVQRLRPCNDFEIKSLIRIVKSSDTYSFFSGHAANSMAATLLVFLIMKKHYRYSFLLFLFPLIFAYSRIYLGLHFPIDILTGYTFGVMMGFVFYKVYLIILEKTITD